jgi:hypothetical protein
MIARTRGGAISDFECSASACRSIADFGCPGSARSMVLGPACSATSVTAARLFAG